MWEAVGGCRCHQAQSINMMIPVGSISPVRVPRASRGQPPARTSCLPKHVRPVCCGQPDAALAVPSPIS